MTEKKPRFDGQGFDRSPFDEDERAAIRQRHRYYDETYRDMTWADPLKPLAALLRALTTLKALGWGGVIGGGLVAFSPELRSAIIQAILGALS